MTQPLVARPFRLKKYEASEYQHQVSLVECLRKWVHPDCCWHSIPNESAGGAAEGWHRKRMGRRPGVADLFFLFRGQALYLELKVHNGYQTDSQQSFAFLVSRARGEYVISHSLSDSLDLLYARGILTRDLTKQS